MRSVYPHIVSAGIVDVVARLSTQEKWQVRMNAQMSVVRIQVPPRYMIGRSQIECLCGRTGLLIRSENVSGSVALRIAYGKSGPVLLKQAPSNPEALAIAYRCEVRRPDQPEIPRAVS